MPDLIAQGEESQERWRRALPEGETIVLGRAAGVWATPWDTHVSRRHAEMTLRGDRLDVKRMPSARNPIFFQGKEVDQFTVRPGGHFVIGGTTFTLVDQHVAVTSDDPQLLRQQTYSANYLKQLPFRNPDRRIEALSRLPRIISGAAGEGELCVRLVSVLLAGVPRAQAVAVVAVAEPVGESDERRPAVEVLHWDQRLSNSGDFQPSQRLIVESLRQGQSVLHVWTGGAAGSVSNNSASFTASGNIDWAFCVPVVESSKSAASGAAWAIYVGGRFDVELLPGSGPSDPDDIREDMKFTELVASTLSSLRQMRRLERQHANLGQFFSPVVIDTLAGEDPEVVLAPRECRVSVLFCDLRGFSRHTERHAENLMGVLERVSQALGVMTRRILDQGGVVGDFQGDAAMGFWGWPLAREDDVARTCRAALAIRGQFESAAQQADSPLAGFHAGIGIATGTAVAGKIGTVDQVKVTVFGPVVNLASRLEGMTKILRASILLDEDTARAVRERVPAEVARVRRLAVVLPYGLDTPMEVSELLPPAAECPQLTDEHLALYESALDAFLARRWSEALQLLHHVPTDDLVTDFLTVYIAKHNRVAPRDFDGVIALETK
ncbi:MAG TPA: adenylate/guanylate cyclase domain-containing protein [Thermoguttaceae bacterium]|nr:adenylate/guanylate cyclase domain-containing protein [Thermoguttaceae bacterium]